MQALHEHIGKDGFRLRGTEMSRIDGFSDVVFGFALTLIVVSLEVPRTYEELHKVLIGFIPFSLCFLFLIMVWYAHFRFFRRYNLHDFRTIVINAALLFTMLFYIYPLKFLSVLLSVQIFGHGPVSEGHKLVPVFTAPWQGRELMVVYGLGFAATYFCLTLLYWNAWRQRVHLRLSELEKVLTLSYLWDLFGVACVGVIAAGVACLFPPNQSGTAGYCFFLIGVWKTIHGYVSGRHIRAAHARTSPEDRLHHVRHG